eukprot:TRINITY_DN25967_c0_g1_i1.p1 TRINITY_DN25967_c0_g1~~TRINITY_DN25967_c0_g1_i1.p1  ORF type:complete len:974 (-),score=245.52 TRINITY_DN25967_c0_g1_i1:160-3081(-)
MRRTAVGIDLGTSDVIAANVGRKGVEVVQNSVSERRTPAIVSFTSRRRLLGTDAIAQVKSNYQNSCRGLKHLMGRTLDSPEVAVEKLWSLAPLCKADDGDVGYQVSYRGKKKNVSATVCLSMLITSIVETCKVWTKMDVRDVVLAIPSYFTSRHRQACLDAMTVAGVNCLRLVHESTAIALAWRFDRRGIDDATPIHVAFCSCGHSGLLVAVARFEKGCVSILGEACDRSVSGRSMDRILLDMFSASLRKQGAPDPLTITKARLKLEEAATKVKKTLSSVDEARGSAECVVEDYDLTCDVKRAAFEEMCAPFMDKVSSVVERALTAAGVTLKGLTYVEVVGGASRVPMVQRKLREAFGDRELSTTLNADEAVAKGCAWQAAMISPLIRLEPMPVHQCGQFPIAFEWEDSTNVEAEGSFLVGSRRRLIIFDVMAGTNAEVDVSMRCRGSLKLSAIYISDEMSPAEALLGIWTLPFPGKKVEDVEVQCSVDPNGVFNIVKAVVCHGLDAFKAQEAAKAEEAARAQEEEAKAQQEAQAAATAKAEDEAAAKAEEEAATAKNEKEDDSPGGEKKPGESTSHASAMAEEVTQREGSDTASPVDAAGDAKEDGDAADATVPEEVGGFEGDDNEAKGKGFNWRFWQWRRGGGAKAGEAPFSQVGPQKMKVGGSIQKEAAFVKRVEVKATVVERPGYGKDALANAVQAEKTFRSTDLAVVEAEDRRNDYETYMFALRDRLSSAVGSLDCASPVEKTALTNELDKAEAWIYDHTEEEASVYAKRLQELKKHEDEIAGRKSKLEAMEEKVKGLRHTIRKYKASATSAIYSYIAKEKLDTIIEECDNCTQWLNDLERRQAELNQWDTPVYSVAELTVRTSNLTNNATKVLSEARPKPPEAAKEKKGKHKKDKKNADKEKESDHSEKEATIHEEIRETPSSAAEPLPADESEVPTETSGSSGNKGRFDGLTRRLCCRRRTESKEL